MNIEKLRLLIAEELGLSVEDVTLDSPLTDLGDSLDIAALILDIEAEMQVEISDDDLHKLFTVRDVANYVDSHSIVQ